MSEFSNAIAWITSHSGLATWLGAIVAFATFVKSLFLKKPKIKSGEKWCEVRPSSRKRCHQLLMGLPG